MSPLEWFGLGLVVFVAAAAYDWACARYSVSVRDGARVRAANWSSITALFGIVGIVGVLSISRWLAIPEVAGYWVGTFFAVSGRKP